MPGLTDQQKEEIKRIAARYDRRQGRLMDMVHAIHDLEHYISQETIDLLAAELGLHRVAIDDMVSFYSFLHRRPQGAVALYLSYCPGHDPTATNEVAAAFHRQLGIGFGETTTDRLISLDKTACIGMCDQLPAVLVKDLESNLVLTRISPQDVPVICEALRRGEHRKTMVQGTADGTSGTFFPNAIVKNVIRESGPVVFAPFEPGRALRTAMNLPPDEVIKQISLAGLRGRGGAGFPTGMKWDFCRRSPGTAHYIICNADEGEPGTFKDRAILTEANDLFFEGLTIGGYAIGAREGFVYLRAEYEYLLPLLEQALARRRKLGLLGENICGKAGFSFDIRIQLGAGAYICGEESALIESLEGKRGAPRDRPPYPVHKGYLQQPTVVNNVETLACVARILEKGAAWFARVGTQDSKGYKLFSVSGDCLFPGVYELPFGLTIDELLEKAGGTTAQAVQLGGAAGKCLAPKDFGRRICYEDAPTGGSVIVIGNNQDLLAVTLSFTEFFKAESCGWCVPCRVGTTMLVKKLEKIKEGKATEDDLKQLKRWCELLATMSRCGLGLAAPNPALTTMRNFPELYSSRLAAPESFPGFDAAAALQDAYDLAGQGRAFERQQA